MGLWTTGSKAAAALGLMALTVVVGMTAAHAQGMPVPHQTTLQVPATEIMGKIVDFYNLVNVIIIAITLFVLALLIYVMFRFSEKSNPTPTKTTHHVGLEVAWTVIPIAILVIIAIPSFKLLNFQYNYPKPDVTIKVTGYAAWYWDYEYLDQKGITVTSNFVNDEDVIKAEIGDKAFNAQFASMEDGSTAKSKAIYAAAAPIWAKRSAGGQEARQLAVDNEMVVPVGKVVHMLVTSDAVIHSWTVPAFGVKMQAVPGRVHATWFKADKPGMYYGQCSVLCGKNHSAMPIAVRVVSEQAYADWTAAMTAKDAKKAKAILKAEADKLRPTSLAQAKTE